MQLKNKMRLTLAFILVLAIIMPLVYTVQHLKSELNRELQEFEQEEIDKLRDNVKNFVDLGYEMINLDYQLLTNRRHIARAYGDLLREQVKVAMHFLQEKAEAAQAGKISLEQAQAEAIAAIRSLRLNSGQDYIWIQTNEEPLPAMIVHPLVPSLDGKILDDTSFNCARGQGDNLFVAAVETAKADAEGGFIDYLWPKILADGSRIPGVAKVSYVRLFPQWNWILGTGIYIDDAINIGIARIRDDIGRIRYDGGNNYFWLHDQSGRLLCHGNDAWLAEADKRKEKSVNVMRGLELIKKHQSGEFFEFKGTIEEFESTDDRIAFIRVFTPLNWVIGTSVSKAGINQRIANKAENTSTQIRRITVYGILFFVVFTAFSVFIIGRILGPFALFESDNPESSGILRQLGAQEDGPADSEEAAKAASQPQQGSISPEILQTISEITRHTVSEQSRLLSLQMVLMNKSATSGNGELENSLQQIRDSLQELASTKDLKPEQIKKRLLEIETRLAELASHK